MSITAANFLSLSLSYMRDMLGRCETWRAMALLRIKYGRLEENRNDQQFTQRPRCVLRHFDGNTQTRVSTSGFAFTGLIYVGFEYPIPEAYRENEEDAYLDAENKLGGIITELARMGMTAGNLHLQQIDITGFGAFDPKDLAEGEAPYYVAELAIRHQGSVL
jgi:hypothetical protein